MNTTKEKVKKEQPPGGNLESPDEKNLQAAGLDTTDNEGDPLNEKSMADDRTGEDLDVPGAELDNENEKIGEEDEENNQYSRSDN